MEDEEHRWGFWPKNTTDEALKAGAQENNDFDEEDEEESQAVDPVALENLRRLMDAEDNVGPRFGGERVTQSFWDTEASDGRRAFEDKYEDEDDDEEGVDDAGRASALTSSSSMWNGFRQGISAIDEYARHQTSSIKSGRQDVHEEAELVVAVRAVRLLSGGLRVAGQQIYIKIDLEAYTRETGHLSAEYSRQVCGEVFHFPVSKGNINDSTMLRVRLKSASNLSSPSTAYFGRYRPNLATVGIHILNVADVGSPDNYVMVELGDQFAEAEMAFYWCPPDDIPSASAAEPSRKLRKALGNPKRRLRSGVQMPQTVLGLDDMRKDQAWVDNPGGLAQVNTYNKLSVIIIRARNLRAADATGYSDPYCVVMCHGRRVRTEVKRATCDPIWEEAVHFPSLDAIDLNDEITIVVRDKDKFSRDDDLGQLSLPLWALVRNGVTGANWYSLSDTDRMNVHARGSYLGQIEVEVIFRPAQMQANLVTSPAARSLANFQSSEVTSKSFELGPEVRTPRLFVRIVQARNLPAADSNGWSDPFCQVRVRGKRQRTRSVKRSVAPHWNQVFEFGANDFLHKRDIVEITLYDKDLITNDRLGTVRLPIYQLTQQPGPEQTTWLQLSSARYPCAGEVQVAAHYVMPTFLESANHQAARDLYKGKEWLYELQLTLLSARGLRATDEASHASSPYCFISCGAHSTIKSRVRHRTVNPIWNQHFKFRQSIDEAREGLGRADHLTIRVFSESPGRSADQALGSRTFDLGFLLDKLGYVDKSGAEFTEYFRLDGPAADEPVMSSEDMDGESNDASLDNEAMDDLTAQFVVGNGLGRSSPNASPRSSRFDALRSTLRRRKHPKQKNSDDLANLGSQETPGQLHSVSPNSQRQQTSNGGHKLQAGLQRALAASRELGLQRPRFDSDGSGEMDAAYLRNEEDGLYGSVRMRIRLVPIGEKRMHTSRKLLVRLHHICDALDQERERFDPQLPSRVILRARLGATVFESSESRFLAHSGGCAVLNAQQIFDHWATHLPPSDRKKASVGSPERDNVLFMDLIDSRDDGVLARATLGPAELERISNTHLEGPTEVVMTPTRFLGTLPKLSLDLRVLEVREELRPVLGFFHLNLLSLKIARDDFQHGYRTVVRYGNTVMTTRCVQGELSIRFLRDEHMYKFAVYEMFTPVVIEVWASAVDPQKNASGSGERRDASKWGTLFGSVTMTVFDMLELEAQVVHSDAHLTKQVQMPRLKLPLTAPSSSGSALGSLWVEAMYEENFWALVAPNPNPVLRPAKPFSLANLRHEVNRSMSILGWFSGAGEYIAYLLNWENYAISIFGVLLTVLFCCVDFYAERVLALPFYLALIVVMRKHYERVNGDLVNEVLKDVQAREVNARVRVAVLQARGLLIKAPSHALRDRHSLGHTMSTLGTIGSPRMARASARFPQTNDVVEELGENGVDAERKCDDMPGSPSSPEEASSKWRVASLAWGIIDMPRRMVRGATTKRGTRESFSSMQHSSTRASSALSASPTGPQGQGASSVSDQALLPCAFARVALRPNFGSRRLLRIGRTWRSFPTSSPDFGLGKRGYSVNRSFQGKLKSQIVPWETARGDKIQAFEFDVKLCSRSGKMILVRLFRAEGLISRGRGGRSDPYVVLQTCENAAPKSSGGSRGQVGVNSVASSVDEYGGLSAFELAADTAANAAGALEGRKVKSVPPGNKMQSSTKRETVDPVWNEEFMLGGAPMVHNADFVELVFKDASSSMRSCALGSLRVQVGRIKTLFGRGSDGPVWCNLCPPKDIAPVSMSQRDGRGLDNGGVGAERPGIAGRVLVHMFVVDMSRVTGGQKLLRELNTSPINVAGSGSSDSTRIVEDPTQASQGSRQELRVNTGDEETGAVGRTRAGSAPQAEEDTVVSPDSWFRAGSEVVVEIVDGSVGGKASSFLGCARIPVAVLVDNEEVLRQPVFERWIPLCPSMDGSVVDAALSEGAAFANAESLGEVLVRVEVLLPDPVARARLMELEEAKRAEKTRVLGIARLRMLNKALGDFQNRLFRINNKMEHAKNLLNWTHPRRSRRVMNVLLILCIMCTLVPSRFVVLFVGLFMFTEHFRRMGTMALRVNHLLSLMPTDDDRREACAGGVVSAKRRYSVGLSDKGIGSGNIDSSIVSNGAAAASLKLQQDDGDGVGAAGSTKTSPPAALPIFVAKTSGRRDWVDAAQAVHKVGRAGENGRGDGVVERGKAWAEDGLGHSGNGVAGPGDGDGDGGGDNDGARPLRGGGHAEAQAEGKQGLGEDYDEDAQERVRVQGSFLGAVDEEALPLAVNLRELRPPEGVMLTGADIDQGFAGSLRVMLAPSSSRLRGAAQRAASRRATPRWTTHFCFLHRTRAGAYLLWWSSRDAFEALQAPEGAFGPILGALSNVTSRAKTVGQSGGAETLQRQLDQQLGQLGQQLGNQQFGQQLDQQFDEPRRQGSQQFSHLGGCQRPELAFALVRHRPDKPSSSSSSFFSSSSSTSSTLSASSPPAGAAARRPSPSFLSFNAPRSSPPSSPVPAVTIGETRYLSQPLIVEGQVPQQRRRVEQLLVLANSDRKKQKWLAAVVAQGHRHHSSLAGNVGR